MNKLANLKSVGTIQTETQREIKTLKTKNSAPKTINSWHDELEFIKRNRTDEVFAELMAKNFQIC